MTGSVVRTVEVGVDPAAAFRAFTEDIDQWFVRGPYSFNYPDRAVALRFEPGVGGRWLEVWADGGGYEWGGSRCGSRATGSWSTTATAAFRPSH